MHLLHSFVRHARWTAKVSPLVLVIAIPAAASDAEQQKSHTEEFRAFYVEFLAAVRANDKNKLADLIAFPVEDWSARRKASSKQSVSRTNPISWQGMTYFSHRLCARMFPGEASEAE